jgi:hypothetical protein
VDDVLTTALASSTFLDVGGGYVIAAALIDAVTANSFSKGNLQPLFGDASAIIALGVGNQYQGGAYNDDGTNDFPTIDQCAAGGCYVFEWLHTGGNLTIRRNGNVSASVASGNSSSLAGNFLLGAGGSASFGDHKLFELVTYKSANIPNSNKRDALVANMLAWIGGQATLIGWDTAWDVGAKSFEQGGFSWTRTFAQSTYRAARTFTTHTSGKHMLEFTCVLHDQGTAFGICDSTFAENYLWVDTHCSAIATDGNVYTSGGNTSGGTGTFGTGDVISIAIDRGASKWWFAKNGGSWHAPRR